MSAERKWTLHGPTAKQVAHGRSTRIAVGRGPSLAMNERVDVVPADAYREAVDALRAVERMLAESGVEGPTGRVVATGNVTCALDRVREALKGQSGPGEATGMSGEAI